MPNEIERASKALGGQAALARALSVSPPTVNQWSSGERPVPGERCPEIERITDAAVCCEDLRPDVRWLRVPDPAWPHPHGRPCIDIAGEAIPVQRAVAERAAT